MSGISKSAVSFLSNWKIGLAVCVPSLAFGLSYYYYYSKKYDRSSQRSNATATNETTVVEVVDGVQNASDAIETTTKTPTEEAEELKKLGNKEFSKRNFDAAITYYSRALSLCPQYEDQLLSALFQNRAAAYGNLNDHENCAADCGRALEIAPMYRKALARRARALKELGDLDLALEDITAVMMIDNFKKQADILFTDTLIESLGKRNLEEHYKNRQFHLPSNFEIVNYIKTFCDDPCNDEYSQTLINSDVNTGLELALKCIRDKNYERINEACIEELNKTDNSLVRRSLALNLLATFCILSGNYDAGLKHLTIVIKTAEVSNKLFINSLIKRASIYHQLGQRLKCFEDLKKAEQVDPNSLDVYLHRAEIHLLEMNSEKAVKDYKRAVELNPQSVLSNLHYCYALYIHANQMLNESDALKYLRKLKGFMSKYPDHIESYTLYAQALAVKGIHREADSILEQIHEMSPENARSVVDRALIAWTWQRSIDDAFKYLELALEIDPKCEYAHETMGSFYNELGQLKKAIKCHEKAILFCKSEKELLKHFSLRNAIQAQLGVVKRFNLKG